MDIKISVVCPTYNSSIYVSRAIDSILQQEELPEEIIFSDDGSTDSTIKIIENFSDKFVNMGVIFKLLKNKHLGPGSARNKAIWESEGSWIAFLDSDDTWEPKKLKLIKQKILQNNYNIILHWENYKKMDS